MINWIKRLLCNWFGWLCPESPETIWIDVCIETSLLPNKWCPIVESKEFDVGTEPMAVCGFHKKPIEYIEIEICNKSKLLSNKWCNDVLIRKYIKGQEPTQKCEICDEPESETVIIDNPKPDWMPKMICDIVQIPFNVGDQYSWEELEELIITLSLAGCDGIRIFATGWKPYIEPFKKVASGEYSFFKPNPKWDETLKRFADMLHKYHMSLEVDLNDNCSHKEPWNPFANNIHGFSREFYGYTKQIKDQNGDMLNEVDFMIKYHDNRVMACLDPSKGDKVRLGNELKSHVENDVSERKVWAEKWGVKRAKNIFAHGFPGPLCFSASEKTGPKLHGFISKEAHPELGWTYRTSCREIHGLGLDKHVEERFLNVSQRRVFSYSNDGVGTNRDSKIPEELRGHCEVREDGSTYACPANVPESIKCVGAFIDKLGNVTFCYSIAFLPREIIYKGKTHLERFDPKASADIYWKLAEELWGINIKRTLA